MSRKVLDAWLARQPPNLTPQYWLDRADKAHWAVVSLGVTPAQEGRRFYVEYDAPPAFGAAGPWRVHGPSIPRRISDQTIDEYLTELDIVRALS
jgi:hypothetical protein